MTDTSEEIVIQEAEDEFKKNWKELVKDVIREANTHPTAPEGKAENLDLIVDKKVVLSSYEEKRQHPRFAVKLPVDYWETPEVIQGGLVANISKRGLLMYSVHKIEINTKLSVRIYLSKNNSLDCIEGNGKIVWMGLYREQDWQGFKYGVYIGEMTPDYEDRLTNYLLMLKEQQNSSH